MAFTVGRIPISSCLAVLPSQGVWSVRAVLTGGQLPPDGVVTVQLGDLALVGTQTRRALQAGRAEVHVVGGAGGWSRDVQRRGYRSDGGVLLRDVAADLAAEAGEVLVVEPAVVDDVLGYAWTRPAGAAAAALSELGRPWWVDPAGITHLGPRTYVQRQARLVLADPYVPSARRATIVSPDDAFAAVQPGSTVTVDGVTLQIDACTILVDDSGARALVQASAAERWGALLEALQERARRAAKAAALQSARIVLQVADRISVQAQPTAQALQKPDLPLLPVVYGLQGVSQRVRLGEGALVAAQGGDPGAPAVVGFAGDAPALETTLDATEGFRIAPSLASDETVDVAGGTRGVAYGDSVATWAEKAHDMLVEIAATLAPLPGSPLALAAAAELAAYNTADGNGWESDTLRTR